MSSTACASTLAPLVPFPSGSARQQKGLTLPIGRGQEPGSVLVGGACFSLALESLDASSLLTCDFHDVNPDGKLSCLSCGLTRCTSPVPLISKKRDVGVDRGGYQLEPRTEENAGRGLVLLPGHGNAVMQPHNGPPALSSLSSSLCEFQVSSSLTSSRLAPGHPRTRCLFLL